MSKWGIEHGDSWPGYGEQDRLDKTRPNPTSVSDNTEERTSLLVDVRGRPLIERVPRRVGFRPEDAK